MAKKTIEELRKYFPDEFLFTINKRFLYYLNFEELLQIQCMDYLKKNYPNVVAFHVPNENGFRQISDTMKYKISRMGLLKGVHDIIILQPNNYYHSLTIELKTPEKACTPSSEQIAFRNILLQKGFQSEICNTFEKFKNIVDYYLLNK